ncbi:DUF6274 family protein [Streptomyces sp. NPDC051561]|uniref:DUF6274 family protein n=1 Tax=Streptomyces sp. NPDC051561 TaxID=3365658 RepID=UPI0037BB4F38
MAASTARHETRALLRAHLAAAMNYRHRTEHCPICQRLLLLAMEPECIRPAPAPAPATEPGSAPSPDAAPASDRADPSAPQSGTQDKGPPRT